MSKESENCELGIFGGGYVGLVAAAGFASVGHRVVVFEVSDEKLQLLNAGKVPFFEPGLEELVKNGISQKLLSFEKATLDRLQEHLPRLQGLLLAVGTPSLPDGRTDLSYLDSVIDLLLKVPQSLEGKILVSKSTVPVGTGERISKRMIEGGKPVAVASNPEFLRQGNAVYDFLKPERIVIGTENVEATEWLRKLYAPLVANGAPLIEMNLRSAELLKYAANAFLATKISFINEISQLCERVGADIQQIHRGLATDSRIGSKFLNAGVGFGGSCFPKDLSSLIHQGEAFSLAMSLTKSTQEVNRRQRLWAFERLQKVWNNDFRGKTIALWGLTFKPNTDDMREAPALSLISRLIETEASIKAYDPQGMGEASRLLKDPLKRGHLQLMKSPQEAVEGADALIILTEWAEFEKMNLSDIKVLMRSPLILDGRNVFSSQQPLKNSEIQYYGVGLPSASA
jgi:UDPglucose 6-dehydrogenase